MNVAVEALEDLAGAWWETPEELAGEFEGQAWWRREKAAEYPDDRRNLEAAAVHDRLAASALACPQETITRAGKLHDEESEVWSSMMRNIGFGHEPADAEAFLNHYIEIMEDRREELCSQGGAGTTL